MYSALRDYRLEDYVYACRTADGIVLLDLKNDAYFGFGEDESRLISIWTHGGGEVRAEFLPRMSARMEDPAKIESLVAELLKNGLLTRGSSQKFRSASPPRFAPEHALLDSGEAVGAAARAKDWLEMLRACGWAACALRLRRLDGVVQDLRSQKMALRQDCGTAVVARAHARMQLLNWMRPFVYNEDQKCLFDSLVTMRFMMQAAICPTLIVGVQTRPFRAHAWLQLENYVLHGDPSHIRQFEPILVI